MRIATLATVTALLLTATPVQAADDQAAQGQNRTQSSAQRNAQSQAGAPDFLFGRPRGSIGARGSWMFASANSDLFDFVERHLTVDKEDFNAPAFGFDFGVAVTNRVDVQFTFESSTAKKSSEYRDFVDNLLLPIEQETSLKERNIGGSVRFSLVPRGRNVSRYAWVPRNITPYVGAGGGALWYKFEQSGDFVDFQDFRVFTDYFESSGFTPSAHVFAGTDIKLYRSLYLTVEGRYLWAKGKLGPDFVDFDPIDLAGFRLATGIHLLF